MSVMTLPERPSTGDALFVRRGYDREDARLHTVVRYSQISDSTFGLTLLSFDSAFATPREWAGTLAVHAVGPTMAETELAAPASSAAETVESLASHLGVPVKDVLAAAGVKKRTFQHWKRNPRTRPRLGSQGQLWALAQSVEVLVERQGAGLAHWIAQEPARRELLRAGLHRDLVRAATVPTAVRDPGLLHRERTMAAGYFDDGPFADDGLVPPMSDSARPAPVRARLATPARAREPKEL
jgi:hypothetical protein